MFTGIVQSKVQILALQPQPAGVRLVVDTTQWKPLGGYKPELGDSICCSGVCLTVVESNANSLSFDVITQTLNVTKIGLLKEGDWINLEPAVMPNQPLGGHFMQGHVDGVGEIIAIQNDPEDWRVTLKAPAELMPYMTPKGSVALDGISLTLAEVDQLQQTITVALIPATLDLTTIGQAQIGDTINLEADVLTKTVIQQMQSVLPELLKQQATNQVSMSPASPSPNNTSTSITTETLKQAGFIKD